LRPERSKEIGGLAGACIQNGNWGRWWQVERNVVWAGGGDLVLFTEVRGTPALGRRRLKGKKTRSGISP